MMQKIGFTILLIIFTCQVVICQNEKPLYDIGYNSKEFIDFSRSNTTFERRIDSMDSSNNCRIIMTSIWFPSNITKQDRKTKFEDFLITTELDSKQDYNPKDSIIEMADKFADYYGIADAQLSELKRYTTQSYYNSDKLQGQFPLIVYVPGMNGFSFDNHLLCEEFAKNGYVVISFNSKGSTKRWMEPNNIDYENQIRDIQFLIGASYNLSFIDNSKICIVGHSIGGYVNILTKVRESRITSLVSLDGSMIHDLSRSHEFTYNDLKKVNCSFLSISPKSFDKAKVYLDSLVYSDRYYYQIPTFGHRDFKSLTYFLKSKLHSKQFDDYQMLNNLIVSFVNSNSEKDSHFIELTSKLSKTGFAKYSSLPSSLDVEDFKSEALSSNFSNLNNILKQFVAKDSSFRLSVHDIYDWGNNLRYYGYFNQAIKVYELLITLYPENMSGYNGSARTFLLQNKKSEAINKYKQALEREPENESIKRKLNKLITVQSN